MRAPLLLTVLAACAAETVAAPAPDRVIAPDAGTAGERDAAAGSPPPDVSARVVSAQNPVLVADLPDPDVLRWVSPEGRVSYILSGTVDSGDFVAYESSDLVHWSPRAGLFGANAPHGPSLALGSTHYCSLWAPALTSLSSGRTFLTFTATRFDEPQAQCPEAREDTGVYVAEATTPDAPFGVPVPFNAGSTCPHATPGAPEWAEPSCFGDDCDLVARLDGQAFVDPADGRAWLGYAWYTNTPPTSAWEEEHYGEHVSVVEVDPEHLDRALCTTSGPVHLGDPHDASTLDELGASCPRCAEHLSATHGREGEDFERDGHVWGVVEAPSFLRVGPWVYVFLSSSTWDSPDYGVYYAFAPSVPELALGSPTRHVGRLLVPGGGQNFGHGAPVLGPDGVHHFFVHHRLLHGPCLDDDDCRRDVWLSPLDLEDRGDGLGAVWPRTLFPAESSAVRVPL